MAHDPLRVRLGRTGLMVSPICFGTWQLSPRFWGPQDENVIIKAIRHALDVGINFYDTADAYGDGLGETILGKAFEGMPREKVIVATKVFHHFFPDGRRHPDLSKEYILEECDASLKRMRLDYIDLYQCHSWDPLTPVSEVVEAMELLVKRGKIRAYGHSNWTVEQMRLGNSLGKFGSCQPQYSLLKREIEDDVLPFCIGNDLGILCYSSLHLGLLSGKYKGTETFTDFRKNRKDFQGERFKMIGDRVGQVGEIARKYGLTTVQLVLAVTITMPGLTCAIVGIKDAQQIEEAAGAMGKTVSREDWHKVRQLLEVPA